jgi:hypothetical protein
MPDTVHRGRVEMRAADILIDYLLVLGVACCGRGVCHRDADGGDTHA